MNQLNNLARRSVSAIMAVLFLTVLFAAPSALAQTTAFTYQGRLTDSQAANGGGSYLMKFELFSDAAGNSPVDSLSNVPVTVTNNIFTVQLNFTAANAFDGTDRFLKISVKRTANEEYTPLNPLQPITSAPYSIKSRTATTADTATNALAVGNTPAADIIKEGDFRLTDSRDPNAGSDNYIQNNPATRQTANFNISGNGLIGGNLGIGTTSVPTTVSLQVNGGIFARGGPPAATGGVFNNNGYAFSGNSFSGMFSSGSGQVDFYSNTTKRLQISPTAVLISGGNVLVSGGNGIVNSAAGNIQLTAGNAGQTSNVDAVPGGNILFQAGDGGTVNTFGNGGAGGSIVLQAGNGGFSGIRGSGGIGTPGNGGAGASVIIKPGEGGVSRDDNNGTSGASGDVQLAPTNGNVGIGTTAPTSKLHVIGNGFISGNFTVTGNLTVNGTINGTVTNATGATNATYAANADKLDNIDSSEFVQQTNTTTFIRNQTSQQTANFNINGSGTIGGTLTANSFSGSGAGLTGIFSFYALNGTPSSGIPANASGYTFIGQAPTVTLTANQRLTGAGSIPLAVGSGTSVVSVGLCYKVNGGAVTNFAGGSSTNTIVDTTYKIYAASATVQPGAGSVQFGLCVGNNAVPLLSNSVNGWMMVTNN